MKPFFSLESPFLNHPLLTPERTKQEVDFVIRHLSQSPGANILDVGCGFGRHCIELARRNFVPLGIDPAPAMIAAAQERSKTGDVPINFDVVDATQLPYTQAFDGAICLFTTLGQVVDEKDNLPLVEQVAKALKPGKRLVVEIPNKPWLIENLKPKDKFGSETEYSLVERKFDPATSRVTEQFTIVSPEKTEIFLLQYRVLDVNELSQLLNSARFNVVNLFGNYQDAPFTDDSSAIIAVAQLKD